MAEVLQISTFSKVPYLTKNQKTPLVLLHGWGLNSAVWEPFIDSLSDDFFTFFDVITIDLPGFGLNIEKEITPYTIDNICQHIANTIVQPAIYLGWSLGGLVATEMALSYSKQVLGLITVASTPRFLEETSEQGDVSQLIWPGIKATVLSAFHQQLQVDIKKTINGFLKIQALGSPKIRHDIKQISQLIFQHEMAKKNTLDQSLQLLETSDYREKLHLVTSPFLRLYGEADSLVPKAAVDKINQLAVNSQQHTFKQASHAPFISHPDDFKETLSKWLTTKFNSKNS